MDKEEIIKTAKEFDRKARQAENFLASIGEETRARRADDIKRIEDNIKDNKELAKLYWGLLD